MLELHQIIGLVGISLLFLLGVMGLFGWVALPQNPPFIKRLFYVGFFALLPFVFGVLGMVMEANKNGDVAAPVILFRVVIAPAVLGISVLGFFVFINVGFHGVEKLIQVFSKKSSD